MSDAKRYYWLKLPENFYEDDTIQWLEDQENGAAYVNFYLKLLLKSLSDDGYLVRYVGRRIIPYDVKSLSRLTNTNPDTVKQALNMFVEIGLVRMMDSGELYMNQIDEMIGTETQAATRMRKMRARKALESDKLNQCHDERNNVTKNRNNVQKGYTEIRDRDRDKDIDKNIDTEEKMPEKSFKYKKTIIDEWNKLDKAISKIQDMKPNTKRYEMTKARVEEYGIEKVLEALRSINNSRFLKGNNNKKWLITYDWFIKPNNFIKVLEGNYVDKKIQDTSMMDGDIENDYLNIVRM